METAAVDSAAFHKERLFRRVDVFTSFLPDEPSPRKESSPSFAFVGDATLKRPTMSRASCVHTRARGLRGGVEKCRASGSSVA